MTTLQAERVALQAKLTAAGLNAVLDPAGVVGSCVLVALPFVERFRKLGDCVDVTAEFRILVMAPSPGNAENAEKLLGDVVTALTALAKDIPSEATPTTYGPDTAPMPTYEFTVTKHVRISQGA
jgi:hypothetical protein